MATPATVCSGTALFNTEGKLPGRKAFNTSSELLNSKPSRPSKLPNTRNTFQPGRVSPKGRTAALNVWAVPAILMKVPDVSVLGAIGSSTSAYCFALPMNALACTTNSASIRPRTSFWPCTLSKSGSAPNTMAAFALPCSMACTFLPPWALA